MAKRTSRGRKPARSGGRSRRTSRSSSRTNRSARGGRGGRRQASMSDGAGHGGVSAPARDEVRQGERDFETA